MEEGLNPATDKVKPAKAAATPVPESFRQQILSVFPCREQDIRTYSPLALAFLGDGVYSMIARTIVVSAGNRQAAKMHNDSIRYVSAHAQALVADAIRDLLTPEEERMLHRGRNSNPEHHAKNASLEDYLWATGLETLCGYLYLTDRTDRLLFLLHEGMTRAGLMDGKD